MQILNGAIVKYVGQWSATYTVSANGLLNQVTAALSARGLSVRSSSQDAGILGGSIFGFTIEPGKPFNVTLSVQVSNGLGYASENDVASVINHEVYIASGAVPTSSSIPFIQQPQTPAGAGAAQNTPQSTGQPDASAGSTTSAPFSFFDSLKNLASNSTLVVAGLGVGLIAAVLLIASPQGRVLRAVR